MGYVNASSIRKAGEHLLALLKDSPTIRYSVHFYDGSEETETRIRDALDIDELESPEGLIDVAAWQLEKMGYVTTTILDSEMSDGEKDYEISITESGRQVIRSETVLQYCDVDE
jgi:hypothetical protein